MIVLASDSNCFPCFNVHMLLLLAAAMVHELLWQISTHSSLFVLLMLLKLQKAGLVEADQVLTTDLACDVAEAGIAGRCWQPPHKGSSSTAREADISSVVQVLLKLV